MFYKKSKENGFTLIEISFSMIIIGIMLAIGFSVYTPYLEKKKVRTTQDNLINIYSALQEYKDELGYFPCAAPLSAARDDTNYGFSGDCSITTTSEGNCEINNEYCVRQSNDTTLANRRVRLGAVPFRELNISERSTYDAFDSKIYYAITESMAIDTSNYNEANGGIDVLDSRVDSGSNVNIAQNVPFIIFSAGSNRVGGYNSYGNAVADCTAPYSGIDLQNCSETLIAEFIDASTTDSGLANEMDDFMFFNRAGLNSIAAGWRTGSSTLATEDDVDIITNRRVKIGDFSETPLQTLHVSGDEKDVRVEEVAYLEGEICESNNITGQAENCFDVNDLVESCPAGEYVTGIGPVNPDGSGKKIICQPIEFSCFTGEMIVGVNSDGTARCALLPPPPLGSQPLPPNTPIECGGTRAVPEFCSGTSGPTFSNFERFDCDTSTWNFFGNDRTSACCVPPNPIVPFHRNEVATSTYRHNDICGPYGEGTWRVPQTFDTNSCNYILSNDNRSCQCDDPNVREYIPEGYNRDRDFITSCAHYQTSYPQNSDERCFIADRDPQPLPGREGTFDDAQYIWSSAPAQRTSQEPKPASGFTNVVGGSCNVFGQVSGCASPGPVELGLHQLFSGCRCVKDTSIPEDRCQARIR